MQRSRNNWVAALLSIAAIVCAAAAFGQTVKEQQTQKHSPLTFRGMTVRTLVSIDMPSVLPQNRITMPPSLFQEVSPCTLISTLAADNYPASFGGPAFQPNETRQYTVVGRLSDGTFVNPCSNVVPSSANAIAVRVNISNATGDGTVYLTPLGWGEFAGTPVIGYLKGDTNIGEESAVMVRNSGIIVGALNGGTDLTVELLGFFVEDKTTPQPTPCVSGSYQLPNMTASTVFPTLRVNDRCVTANSLVMVNSSGLFGVTVNAQGDGWVEFTGLGGQAFRYIVFGGKP